MPDTTGVLFAKAQTYLRSAAVLYELEDFDSCASRCYFAMFYAVQAVLLHEQGALPSQQGIRSAFIEAFVETGRLPERAEDALALAHDLYEQGDYSHRFAVDAAAAERALQEAEAFVNSLAALVSV